MIIFDTAEYVNYNELREVLSDLGVANLALAPSVFAEGVVFDYVRRIQHGNGFVTYPKIRMDAGVNELMKLDLLSHPHIGYHVSRLDDDAADMFNIRAINYAMHRLNLIDREFTLTKMGAIPSGCLKASVKRKHDGKLQDYRYGSAG